MFQTDIRKVKAGDTCVVNGHVITCARDAYQNFDEDGNPWVVWDTEEDSYYVDAIDLLGANVVLIKKEHKYFGIAPTNKAADELTSKDYVEVEGSPTKRCVLYEHINLDLAALLKDIPTDMLTAELDSRR